MFIAGYIPGVIIAVILSLFYLGCAVNCASRAPEQCGSNTAEITQLTPRVSLQQQSCFDYIKYFHQRDDDSSQVAGFVDADEKITHIPKTPCRQTALHTYALFSRPPPHRTN
jgi:hypothetical protein